MALVVVGNFPYPSCSSSLHHPLQAPRFLRRGPGGRKKTRQDEEAEKSRSSSLPFSRGESQAELLERRRVSCARLKWNTDGWRGKCFEISSASAFASANRQRRSENKKHKHSEASASRRHLWILCSSSSFCFGAELYGRPRDLFHFTLDFPLVVGTLAF